MLAADFSGLANLDDIMAQTLERLSAKNHVQATYAQVARGNMQKESFDFWFAEMVRQELGKTLGIIRNKAKRKAEAAGAGSAASAILRRNYKDRLAANLNIAGNKKRISSKERVVEPPTGGESGIRRHRTVKKRTDQLRRYFGPDRGFILRILESGRDEFMATGEGPTGRGSKSTHGRRGSIAARHFFGEMKQDMEQAAAELGTTLTNRVEKWLESNYKTINNK